MHSVGMAENTRCRWLPWFKPVQIKSLVSIKWANQQTYDCEGFRHIIIAKVQGRLPPPQGTRAQSPTWSPGPTVQINKPPSTVALAKAATCLPRHLKINVHTLYRYSKIYMHYKFSNGDKSWGIRVPDGPQGRATVRVSGSGHCVSEEKNNMIRECSSSCSGRMRVLIMGLNLCHRIRSYRGIMM